MGKTFHCFFEQSGTFKNEFKKLGYHAEDYDILNDFNETDHIIDLFGEIEKSYGGGQSIFDAIKTTDMILAFFPCVRFENQIIMHFQATALGVRDWSLERQLQYDMKLHEELHHLYCLISKLVIVCIRKNIPLIIENPFSQQHYLTRYWALRPKLIDEDRRETGDYYKKPTQYWFVNCVPQNNFIFESVHIKEKRLVNDYRAIERSLISKDYANRFIREFILEDTGDKNGGF